MFSNIVRNLSNTVVNGVTITKKTKTYNYTEMGIMILSPIISIMCALVSYNNYQKIKNRYDKELESIENMEKLESIS